MKINKEHFKSIVKECLVEILSEGINAAGATNKPTQKTQQPQQQSYVRNPSVDAIKYSPSQPKINSSELKKKIASVAGGDPIMASNFEDTARSTLPKMLNNDRHGVGIINENMGREEMIVAQSSIEDLFGRDESQKWAALAFSANPTKNH